ncbi:UBN2_3 domain-containing protein, partial [Cephalotus follicularis]
VLSLPGWIR